MDDVRRAVASGEPGLHRVGEQAAATGHREQADRLRDDDEPAILEHDARLVRRDLRGIAENRRGIDVEAGEHVREDRAALAAAGGIRVTGAAIARRWRRPEPDLGERDRHETLAIRVGEQLRCRAITGTAGRRLGGKQLADRARLAACIRERVGLMDRDQQIARARGAVRGERTTRRGELGDASCQRCERRLVRGLQRAALRRIAAALLIEHVRSSSTFAHELARCLALGVARLQRGELARIRRDQRGVLGVYRIGVELALLLGQHAEPCFTGRPECIARRFVERRTDEAVAMPTTVEHAAERAEITESPVAIAHDQRAEHLALAKLADGELGHRS